MWSMLRSEGNHKWICIFCLYFFQFGGQWFVVCAACVPRCMNKESPCNMKDTNRIKTAKFFPSFHFSWLFFSCVGCVLFACFRCCSVKHTALLKSRQNKIRCFVVAHMPKTKDKKRLVPSHGVSCRDGSVQNQELDFTILVSPFQLKRFCDSVPHHRPSVQAVGVWRSWLKSWRESKVPLHLCNSWWEQCDVTLSRVTVLMYLWTWARGRKAVRQPLVRSFSLQSRFLKDRSRPTRHEKCLVRMYSLWSAGLQTG